MGTLMNYLGGAHPAHLMLWVLGAVLVILVGSCTFGVRDYPQRGSPLNSPDTFVLQVDDYGAFWDRSVATQALSAISAGSHNTNTFVVLFIHGWHHNAAADDGNVADFAHSLQEIRTKLGAELYRASRERLTGSGSFKVVGVYVGWRGKSLPMPLDYLTYWGRKAAAERVGDGDLREFLIRLNQLYQERAIERAGSKQPFLGMISIGHSFGGQVLFRAISGTLERELVLATGAAAPGTRVQLDRPIIGFGDLTILINPALEAFQFDRIHRLSREIDYSSRQPPLLLVLSSATDAPRKIFFPIGRTIDAFYRAPFRPGQRQQWTQALGEYAPQRTHTVEVIEKGSAGLPGFDPALYTNNPCDIINYDLTDLPSIGGVQLKPTAAHPHPFSPFIVAYASGDVVIRHSGIFEEALRNFLNDYVAIAEGKRMLLADPELNRCPSEGSDPATSAAR